jgi:hypothetical protein
MCPRNRRAAQPPSLRHALGDFYRKWLAERAGPSDARWARPRLATHHGRGSAFTLISVRAAPPVALQEFSVFTVMTWNVDSFCASRAIIVSQRRCVYRGHAADGFGRP